MIASLLIGLREGLEASIIVAILIAYLVKRDLRSQISRLWFGVAAAVVASLGAAGILALTSSELPEKAEQTFAGVTSLAAAGLITWLTFWMAEHARHLKQELHSKLDSALTGSQFALVGVAFFAVVREGLETAVFMVSAVQVSGSFSGSFLGLLFGLSISILIGYLVFKGVLKLNLGKVFATIGAALIVVAAGVLAYGAHELQESGILPFWQNNIVDTTSVIDPEGVVGSLLKGFLAYRGTINPLELLLWSSFVLVVGLKYRATLNAKVVAPVEAEKVSA
jgi:high-affinity iron transporter